MAAIDLTTLGDYTGSQLKLAAKHAMLTAALGGGTLTINGRALGRITIDQAKALYEFGCELEAADTAAETGAGNVLVQFGEIR